MENEDIALDMDIEGVGLHIEDLLKSISHRRLHIWRESGKETNVHRQKYIELEKADLQDREKDLAKHLTRLLELLKEKYPDLAQI